MAREISAGIIIYRRDNDRHDKKINKYLLLYRGYWNFPKGKLEQNERSYQAAFREIEEETGIQPSSLKMERDFKVTDKFIYQREGENIFKIVIFFLAQTNQSLIKLSPEQEGYGWLPYYEAMRLLKHQNSKNMLKKANDYLKRKNIFRLAERHSPPLPHKKAGHPSI